MTLTEFAYYLRRVLPLAVLGVIIILILYLTLKIVELTRPTTPLVVVPTPTPAFGQLAPITLNNVSPLPMNMKYVMDTVEGVPLTATTSARIYFIPKKTPNLGFREKANVLAKALQFDEATTTTKLDTTSDTYTLVDRTKRLVVDIDNFNYTYSQDFDEETREFLARLVMPNEEKIISKGQEILRSLNRYPPDLAQGIQTISFIAYKEASGSAQASAEIVQNPQSANMVAVDFFPPKLNELDTVTEDFVSSPNRVVFIPQGGATDFVVKAQVEIFERSEEQNSSYPLKTGDQVFQDLHAGKGFFIQGMDSISGKTLIKIKKMYLAYLIPGFYTTYIQPVYVFIGEDNFVAYVPAVADEWIQGAQTLTESPTISNEPADTPSPTPISIPVR
jgi:hypothetical protein